MKKAKILSVALATLVAASLAATTAFSSFAASETPGYTITVNDSETGYSYEAYQIFKGTLDGTTLSDIEWGDGVNKDSLLSALQSDTTTGIDFSSCTTAAQVADKISKATMTANQKAALADVIGANLSAVTSGSPVEGSKNITNLPAGYYLVKNSQAPSTGSYTNFILEVVKDTQVNPKRDVPTVEKKVTEGDYPSTDADKASYGDKYNDVADYSIGDTINFELIGSIPSNYDSYDSYAYTFTDTYSNGITPDFDTLKVYIETDGNLTSIDAAALTAGTDYTLDTTTSGKFTVSFTDLKQVLPNYIAGAKVVVRYDGALNANAEIGLDGNPNTVKLTYSNNPNGSGTGTTPDDKVIVFTYEIDVNKIDGDTNANLDGVTFKLLNSAKDKVAVVTDGKFVEWVAVAYDDDDNITSGTALTTDSNGLIKVAGLEDVTYYAVETAAKAGYNKLTAPVEIVLTATTVNGQNWDEVASSALTNLAITADSKSGTVSDDKGTGTVEIANFQGSTLPSTGGIGTTIFYVCGGIIVAAAVVLLIVKMRKREA